MKTMIHTTISPFVSKAVSHTAFHKLRAALVLTATGALLASCGSGSGSATVDNVNTQQPGGSSSFVYQGPSPQTDDVQNFRINLFDNLVDDPVEVRCGTCHGVDQAPLFLDRNDVNNAYNVTLTQNTVGGTASLVDFENPSASRLVTKVQEGHNCWTTNNDVCANIVSGYIEDWASQSGSVSNVIILTAPEIKDPGASRTFPESAASFQTEIYDPILEPFCSRCHSDTGETLQQQPFFASDDIDLAYANAQPRIDLQNPGNSRLVVRLRSESHNCWTSSCTNDANAMEAAITAFVSGIPITEINPDLVTSKALGIEDGVLASSGGRVETNAIALYEFMTGEGSIAFDTSGVSPALDLNISGDVDWIGSGGIRIIDGKAQATTSNSSKLYEAIATGTGEYAIEAWVVPSNVTQDGPARIVSYSGGDDVRNFTLGQTIYNYNFLNRSSLSDENGQPFVSTPDADEILQATLQHVVVNYDPVSGRTIYVNGELVSEAEPIAGGDLNGWDDSYAFVVGNEVSNNNLWQGSVRLLAVYNRTMSEEDIVTNFDVGVGETYFLLFSITDLIGVPDAYIVFEVEQFDDYSYLFNEPFFTVLSGDATAISGIDLRGMRIGINGREANQGQAYATLDTQLNGAEFVEGGQPLSSVGTVIAVENGAEADEFFLTFDTLGAQTFARTDNTIITTDTPADLEQSLIGLKTFEEIDASLSEITTIPRTTQSVSETFEFVKQQLPNATDIGGFVSAHQMGINQLAIQYCNALVDPANGVRGTYFPGFDFNAPANTAFDVAGRAQIVDPILERLLSHDFSGSGGLDDQPDPAVVETELNTLIDRLVASCGTGCNSTNTRNIVLSACAAASGSALMLVQ